MDIHAEINNCCSQHNSTLDMAGTHSKAIPQTQKQFPNFNHYLSNKLEHSQSTALAEEYISREPTIETSIEDMQGSEILMASSSQQQSPSQKTPLSSPTKTKRKPKQRQQD